jgi:nitrate reductase cytochrome c-type subunit
MNEEHLINQILETLEKVKQKTDLIDNYSNQELIIGDIIQNIQIPNNNNQTRNTNITFR